ALYFTIISTVSIYIIVLILNFFSVFSPDVLVKWLIPLGLFPIISNSVFMVFVSYFQATKKIKLLSNLTISNKLLSIIAIIILTYWLGIKGYYIAFNLSFLFMLFVCFKIIGTDITQNLFSFKKLPQFKLHWRYAKTSMFAYLMSEMSAYVDIILLTVFITDMHQIGYYSFALTLTVLIKLFPSTVQQITIPYFSSLANQKTEFQVVFKRYNKILYMVVFTTFIGLVIISPYFINLIFHGKYDESMKIFPYLALGWSLRQLGQLQNGAVFGLGKIHYNVYQSAITVIFNIITISLLLYYFGVIGAAYASILGGIVFSLTSSYFYRKAQSEM
ncbi:MAG: oligosaccharide flippase family protein, partial [Paludibacter sp.]